MSTAKFWVALVLAALNGVAGVLPIDSTAARWVQFALAVVSAIAVYFTPNAQAKRRQNHTLPHAGR